MEIFLAPIIFCLLMLIYWLNRQRRIYLKKRIGNKWLLNLHQVSRNIAFMIGKKELQKISGSMKLLANGGILYSFHFGIWELMPRTLSKLGYTLAIVTNRYSSYNRGLLAKLVDRMLLYFRSRGRVTVFYKDDITKIIKFIKKRGILAMLVDGNTFSAKLKKAERLARLCGVPLVPFAAYREDSQGILEIGCDLDNLVSRRPYDYLWFYRSREGG